jgi:hypothetical protein
MLQPDLVDLIKPKKKKQTLFKLLLYIAPNRSYAPFTHTDTHSHISVANIGNKIHSIFHSQPLPWDAPWLFTRAWVIICGYESDSSEAVCLRIPLPEWTSWYKPLLALCYLHWVQYYTYRICESMDLCCGGLWKFVFEMVDEIKSVIFPNSGAQWRCHMCPKHLTGEPRLEMTVRRTSYFSRFFSATRILASSSWRTWDCFASRCRVTLAVAI